MTNPENPEKLSAIERAIQLGYAALADGSPETVMAYARGVAHVAYNEGRRFERHLSKIQGKE